MALEATVMAVKTTMPMSKSAFAELTTVSGQAPLFPQPIHVGRPNQGDRARLFQRIEGILDRNWLTNDGPLVREFEDRVSDAANVEHCVATCNGTSALEVLIRAADLRGEVIVPALTFVATVHALQWLGLTPVLCDITPGSHHIDPTMASSCITPETSAILAVHTWGLPADVDSLREIADHHSLHLFFDAAHAFGNTHHGTAIGNFGDAEVFSFHATKFVNAFEGGAIVTNNQHLADRARHMRNFGFTGYDRVEYLGTNAKMSEVSAAQGLTTLESVDLFRALNSQNFDAYRSGLATVPGIELQLFPHDDTHNKQYVVAAVDQAVFGISRDRLAEILWAENVLVRRYFYPGCHRMEPYRSNQPTLKLPNTEHALKNVLVLPTGSAVGTVEVQQICDLIRLIQENANRLR